MSRGSRRFLVHSTLGLTAIYGGWEQGNLASTRYIPLDSKSLGIRCVSPQLSVSVGAFILNTTKNVSDAFDRARMDATQAARTGCTGSNVLDRVHGERL